MSVFNHEEFLDESIQSILNQTFKDFEFIIINDASTDSTLEIIKKYQIKDKRIQLIINKKNIGLTKSLNKGLKISKGKYIARQDADDVSLPKRLEKQYEFLEKNKQIILCGTDYINIDDKGQKLPKRRVIYDWKKIKKILPKDNPFVHSSIMFRNKGLFYREKFELAQDYDLYLNLLTKGMKMINLKRVLIKHRYNLETMSVYGAGKRLQLIKIIRYFYKQRIDHGVDSYEKFNPEKIIKKSDKNHFKLEGKMVLYLKFRDYKKARVCLKKYSKLKNVSWSKKCIYTLCVYFPVIYKVYSSVIYKYK